MIPSPLYKDPIYNGPADPMIIRKESDGLYYMFYTQRRSNQQVENVSYCYGCAIGVAESPNGRDWHYRGALDLDFEFGHNTFWAPEVVYDPQSATYHMFVTYIQGVYINWDGVTSIEHYTSKDLFDWEHVGKLTFGSSRIIDPCIYRLPDGTWRMWYKDERQSRPNCTCYADSPDLYNWTYRGVAADDCEEEGPNVFALGGKYWLIADVWDGQAVYWSDDLTHFVRQPENILRESGTRPDDAGRGAHADVFTVGNRAFIVYFTHPDPAYHPRSTVQMAELTVRDGKLCCDRNAEFDVDWSREPIAPQATPATERPELTGTVHPLNSFDTYKYVVVCTFLDGKLVLSRHRERATWETQGGHIEPGETPPEAARRELYEESGIRDAEIIPICDYCGYRGTRFSYGVFFVAKASAPGVLPASEIAEVRIFDALPEAENLTYPLMTPLLYEEARKMML